MSTQHFDIAITAFVQALGDRLAPGISDFPGLFTEDATIEVPFDSDGTAQPIVGRAAIHAMTAALEGVLRFDEVEFSVTHMTGNPDVVVCEYNAVLTRFDLGGQFRRRYISVVTLQDGHIAHLREYGGPFLPVHDSQ